MKLYLEDLLIAELIHIVMVNLHFVVSYVPVCSENNPSMLTPVIFWVPQLLFVVDAGRKSSSNILKEPIVGQK